ncbi:MAG: hypothetical protein K6F50_03735 [Kiritimatiellae bacterium]|nr:hypothetical protein [Kiritimatiellia bacterium]
MDGSSANDGAFDQITPLPLNAKIVDGHAVVECSYEYIAETKGISKEVLSNAPAAFFKPMITPTP